MKLISRCALALLLLPAPLIADDFSLSRESTTQRIKSGDNQWTGHSITIIEAEEWEETPRWDIEDLEGLAPNLIVDGLSAAPVGAAISLRGISSRESSAAFFPSVAVKVDDVYIGTHASQNQILYDLDRIEIRRGPQGGFEGAPATGGSIAVYRALPTEELDASVTATVADWDRKRINAYANAPFGALDLRFSIAAEDGGDFINNVSPDPAAPEANTINRTSWRGTVLWNEVEDVSIRYTVDLTRDDSDVPALANISLATDLVCDPSESTPNCAAGDEGKLPETGGFRSTTQNFSNYRNYDVDQHAFHIDYQWQDLVFKSVTAWRDTSEFSAFDYDGTFDNTYSGIVAQDYSQFTQELTVLGSYSERLDYSTGVFIMGNEYRREGEDFFILPVLDEAGRIISVTPDASRSTSSSQDADLISFWVHGDLQASEQWKLDAGIRWTNVDRAFEHTVSRLVAGDAAPLPAIVSGRASSSEAIGTMGATYRVDDEALVYIRYERSFRPVTFSDAANSVEGTGPLIEESVDGFEIGLKTEWFNDRLRLNYVGYENNWRDKLERVAARVESGRVESILSNVAKVEVRGHELEIEYVPAPFLRFRATLGHMNADYKEYEVPSLDTGDLVSFADLVPPMAPADQFGFSGTLTRPYGEGMLRFYGSYRFTREYTSNSPIPSARINNFSMIDLSVDYEWREWTFRLFSRNTNDKRYLTNVNQAVDAELASLAPTFRSNVPIATTADFNEPEMTGIQIIYVPQF